MTDKIDSGMPRADLVNPDGSIAVKVFNMTGSSSFGFVFVASSFVTRTINHGLTDINGHPLKPSSIVVCSGLTNGSAFTATTDPVSWSTTQFTVTLWQAQGLAITFNQGSVNWLAWA